MQMCLMAGRWACMAAGSLAAVVSHFWACLGPEKWASKQALGLIENKGETTTTKIKTRGNIDERKLNDY